MRKALLMALLILGATAAYAATLALPLPVNGRIVGDNVGGQKIIVTNSRTGISLISFTTDQGEFLVDWANSDDDPGSHGAQYLVGDEFTVKVAVCDKVSTLCSQTKKYSGQTEIFFFFDLGKTIPPPPPQPSTCPPTNCGGGSGHGIIYECSKEYAVEHGYCEGETPSPSCPTTTCPPQKECPAQTACPSCEVCQDIREGLDGNANTIPWITGVAGLIIGGIAGFLVGRRHP